MTIASATLNPLRRAVVIGALGVVFGDIGTSPIYTFRECLKSSGNAGNEAVLGLLSLVFWALMVIVTIKYVCFVMRADNDGEGGIIALLGLASSAEVDDGRRRWLVLIGLAGAALFYGDGMITPAISVLSAVEGLEVATPLLKPYVVPLTVVVLVGLFAMQSRGSARIGMLFGPVIRHSIRHIHSPLDNDIEHPTPDGRRHADAGRHPASDAGGDAHIAENRIEGSVREAAKAFLGDQMLAFLGL